MIDYIRYLRDYSLLLIILYSIKDISILFYLSYTTLERIFKLIKISFILYLSKTKLIR